MLTDRKTIVFLMSLLAAVAAVPGIFSAPAHAQTVHHPPGADWSIAIPAGWRLGDLGTLAEINSEAQKLMARSPNAPRISYVLLLVPEQPNGQYALVQSGKALPPGVGFDEAASSIIAEIPKGLSQIKQDLGSEIADASLDRPEADQSRRRIIASMTMSGPDGAQLKTVSAFYFGAHESMTIHCYAPAADFENARPTLQAIADSFAFDPGSAYAFNPKSGQRETKIAQAIGFLTAILVSAVGCAVWFIRKKRAAA